MTIKDMELQTGLARANIRYYEAEGLIAPERAENGYREYSQEDAETLLRVKLLRALGLTVGQIKAIVRGETELDAALSARIAAIQKEKAALDRAGEIAGRLRQAHAQFRTLDARPYLDEMQTERVLERDTLPKEHFPWQRFFARLLDGQIYRTLWMLLLPALGFNMLKNSRGGMLFLELLTLGTMFLLEPLLLSRFGTTPGKWLFGLRVTSPDGRKLTYAEGRERFCPSVMRKSWMEKRGFSACTACMSAAPMSSRGRNFHGKTAPSRPSGIMPDGASRRQLHLWHC